MIPLKHIALLLCSPIVAGVLAFGFGRVTAPPPKLVPNNEQLTVAATTLVHNLEQSQGLSLGDAPTFLGCHATVKPVGGLACDFGVDYFDESTATWELVLDRQNVPLFARKVKDTAAPAPAA